MCSLSYNHDANIGLYVCKQCFIFNVNKTVRIYSIGIYQEHKANKQI
jgi:hypothetical protein